jgi:hypothetical protein
MQNLRLKAHAANIPPVARPASAAVGLFDASEFPRAQAEMPELAAWSDYEDWLDSREGLQMGLAMAGVDAQLVRVRLDSFLAWRALAGAASSETALDAFARLALTLRIGRKSRIFAVVGEADFEQHRFAVGTAFGRTGFAQWRRHRARLRASALSAGLAVEDQPIRLSEFLEWSDCVGQRACEPALDRYARLLAEHLLSD